MLIGTHIRELTRYLSRQIIVHSTSLSHAHKYIFIYSNTSALLSRAYHLVIDRPSHSRRLIETAKEMFSNWKDICYLFGIDVIIKSHVSFYFCQTCRSWHVGAPWHWHWTSHYYQSSVKHCSRRYATRFLKFSSLDIFYYQSKNFGLCIYDVMANGKASIARSTTIDKTWWQGIDHW